MTVNVPDACRTARIHTHTCHDAAGASKPARAWTDVPVGGTAYPASEAEACSKSEVSGLGLWVRAYARIHAWHLLPEPSTQPCEATADLLSLLAGCLAAVFYKLTLLLAASNCSLQLPAACCLKDSAQLASDQTSTGACYTSYSSNYFTQLQRCQLHSACG